MIYNIYIYIYIYIVCVYIYIYILLHTTLHQRGYPTTLIHKELEFTEKIPQRELRNLKKHKKPLSYIATYNKNNPKLFTEIMKNLEELKTRTKSKKY